MRIYLLLFAAGVAACTQDQIGSTARAVVSGAYSAVDNGRNFACAIRSADGALFCWGANSNGQLGIGAPGVDRASPQQVGSLVAQVASAGERHACAISNGALYCWGANNRGQLGIGSTAQQNAPARVGTDNDWIAVAAGQEHTCGVRRAGTDPGSLWCWGFGNARLGLGSITVDVTSPAAVATGIDWAQVTAGQGHSCALTSAGALYCWGDNTYGAIGDGTTTWRTTPTAIGTATYTKIDAGDTHNCAIRSDGALLCWGNSNNWQTASRTFTRAPTQVGTELNWTAIAGGSAHSCAIAGGALYCVGANQTGQLGLLNPQQQWIFQRIGTANDWSALSASSSTCGLHTSGVLDCWGSNTRGELGAGVAGNKTQPARVSTMHGWRSVAPGGYHTCAIRYDGTLHCFGHGVAGQLGTGAWTGRSTPGQVGTWTDWAQVATGTAHSCALRTNGALYCWGLNNRGQATPAANPTIPSQVAGTWLSISTGYTHTCGIQHDNTLWCWGENNNGQLGTGLFAGASTPALVGGGYRAVRGGGAHTCAIALDGRVSCFGNNAFGQLGNGTLTESRVPVLIADTASYRSLALGLNHSCGVRENGELACWGQNNAGQIGAPFATGMRSTAAAVGSATDWAAVTANGSFTCGLRSETAYCFGANAAGQLGDGTTVGRFTPAAITSMPNEWVAIGAGATTTCGVLRAGGDFDLYCWGDNTFGQVGDGSAWAASTHDECLAGAHTCSSDARCSDTTEGFTCACNSGYAGDGTTCTNVDECAANNGGCSAAAGCTDHHGWRTCACSAGYSGDGINCADVDECAIDNGGCGDHSLCENTAGSFQCACEPGWGDCDEAPANGCELDLATSALNCGACGNVCPGGSSAVCSNATCTDLFDCPTDQVTGLPVSGTRTAPVASSDFLPLCDGVILYGDRTLNQIVRYDVLRNQTIATYSLGAQPGMLELDAAHGYLYVGLSTAFVVRIELATGAQVSIPLPGVPAHLALGNDGRLFVTYTSANHPPLAIIDGSNATVVRTIPNNFFNADFGRLLAYDHVHDRLISGTESISPSSLSRFAFDPATDTLTQLEHVFGAADGNGREVSVSSDGERIAYAAGGGVSGQGYVIGDYWTGASPRSRDIGRSALIRGLRASAATARFWSRRTAARPCSSSTHPTT